MSGGFAGVRQPTPDSCLSACVASILGVPIHRTPRVEHDAGEAWLDRYNVRLRRLLAYEIFSLTVVPVFEGYWIAVVPSLNLDAPGGHAVVMEGPRLVWDPSTRERYERIDMSDVTAAMFLLPLYPKAPCGVIIKSSAARAW